ncbi:MAG TPA: right-handed parallel beta-helix repeat-containing protein [Ktedonobacterales bacterium]
MRPAGDSQRRGWRLLALGVVLLLLTLSSLTGLVRNPSSAAAVPSASPVSAPLSSNLSNLPDAATLPSPATRPFDRTLRVPADYPTIQAAVDAAQAGDLVLVSPGIYHEAVKVKTAGVTIRGTDRNTVILDGQSQMPNGIFVSGDNVILEDLTAHNYAGNGFQWSHVTGYRGSYLTAYDNGDYGLYALHSTQGEFDHDYASGNPDSGFYIGECFPCDALITNVLSENNGLGYSGTNAGGNLIIRNSTWRHNAAGIVPNTLDSELMAPERGTTITSNEIIENNNADAPQFFYPRAELGIGIGLPGANLNYVADNHIVDQADYGILVSGIFDDNFWLASGNVVERNRISGSGIADLALASPIGANNCFTDNVAATTLPPLLELTHPCGSPLALDGGGDFSPTLRVFARYVNACGPTFPSCGHRVLGSAWQTYKVPDPQPNMPDVNAPRGDIFTEPFPLANTLPNDGLPIPVGSGGPGMLQPLGFTGYSIVQLLLALYGNLLLFALYAVWLTMAIWELGHRDDLSPGRKFGLGALVVGVPLIGPIVYYFAGGSKLGRGFRLGLVVGAPLLCIVVTVILLVIASFTL